MASSVKGIAPKQVSGKNRRVVIVSARWNASIVGALVEGCRKTLLDAEVHPDNIVHVEVPGSFELPFAASRAIQSGSVDAVVCIGVLIKGETMHFEYIASAVSQGIMDLGLKSSVPVIFGVLTCLTEEQALARAGLTEKGHNHGVDWGLAALEMIAVSESL
eukprot:Unigene6372_Nuclearia_a/m.19644 Unigene6372_Nuclearia_a/g.19644  ORF Unigene6372_Nuclearia_a/g.19644 Unigene6372_Nuclearia_a/m.19644 type:complete len:161 (+) Unigene6372_Nuclearia_a:64-546(+)